MEVARPAISASPGSEGIESAPDAKAGTEPALASSGTKGKAAGNRCISTSLGSLSIDGNEGTDGAGVPNCGRRVSKFDPIGCTFGEDCTGAGADVCPGNARKNSFAICVNEATSGSSPLEATLLSCACASSAELRLAILFCSLVLMVVSDLDVFEHTKRILGQHRCRTIKRNQIRGNRVTIDSHKTNGKPGSLFARQPRPK